MDTPRWRLRLPLGVVAALLIVGSMGCKPEKVVTSSGSPGDWSVRFGSSGGFTGGGAGYEILASGAVSSWKRVTAQASVTSISIGSASAPSVNALFEAMTAPDLVSLKLSASGNMTSFLEWRQGDESRRYSWEDGVTPPEPVARAQAAALAAIRDAQD